MDTLGTPLQITLEAGVPADSPAQREAAERARRQRVAEDSMRGDLLVAELLAHFPGAQLVPGTIKPL